MNGLEAIKVMMEGKLVSRYYGFGLEKEIYKIIDGNVHVKLEELGDEEYQIAEEFDFDETYDEYIEPKPLTGWERVKDGKTYYSLEGRCISQNIERNSLFDERNYESSNYFSNKEKVKEIYFKQTLFRKLQRFSDENGGSDIDWKCEDSRKYLILYNHTINKLLIDCRWCEEHFGQVYFVSYEVAEKAIELFRDDLIKYFTQY